MISPSALFRVSEIACIQALVRRRAARAASQYGEDPIEVRAVELTNPGGVRGPQNLKAEHYYRHFSTAQGVSEAEQCRSPRAVAIGGHAVMAAAFPSILRISRGSKRDSQRCPGHRQHFAFTITFHYLFPRLTRMIEGGNRRAMAGTKARRIPPRGEG